jgi:hypothetical protein
MWGRNSALSLAEPVITILMAPSSGSALVPVGAQFDDLVVQMHADVAAHGDDHRLAGLRLAAFLEVRHQVLRHAGHAGFGTDHLFQCGPAASQLGLVAFFFVFGQLVHFGVNQWQVVRL